MKVAVGPGIPVDVAVAVGVLATTGVHGTTRVDVG